MGYLADLQTMTSPREVADFTVDHVRASTGARWAEVVQTNPANGALITLAAADGELTDELQHCRAVADEPPAPGNPSLAPTIVLDDLAVASPWPRFAALATARTPVRSAVLTYVAAYDTAVVVPVYDDRPRFFTAERRQYAALVAQLAGLVLTRLAMTETVGHLRVAIASRDHVATAIAMLCARRGLSPEAAFQLLRATSSHTNRKLRDIATDVLRDGDLPTD